MLALTFCFAFILSKSSFIVPSFQLSGIWYLWLFKPQSPQCKKSSFFAMMYFISAWKFENSMQAPSRSVFNRNRFTLRDSRTSLNCGKKETTKLVSSSRCFSRISKAGIPQEKSCIKISSFYTCAITNAKRHGQFNPPIVNNENWNNCGKEYEKPSQN